MDASDLGQPSVEIGGLAIWVHGRQFPDSEDFYDGNWLRVTAHCGALRASVWADGAILMVNDLQRWADESETLYRSLAGEAVLSSYAPDLKATIKSIDTTGHLVVRVEITPDHMTQRHQFDFTLDQSFLPSLIRQCRHIVTNYPIRDPEKWRRVPPDAGRRAERTTGADTARVDRRR